MREFVHNVLQEIEISSELSNLIILAVDEACTNVIIHGNNSNPKALLKLEIQHIKNQLTIKVMDTGEYTPKSTKFDKNIVQNCIDNRSKGGLGLYIMHKVMDKVEFLSEEKLNFCLLSKKIPPSII